MGSQKPWLEENNFGSKKLCHGSDFLGDCGELLVYGGELISDGGDLLIDGGHLLGDSGHDNVISTLCKGSEALTEWKT